MSDNSKQCTIFSIRERSDALDSVMYRSGIGRLLKELLAFIDAANIKKGTVTFTRKPNDKTWTHITVRSITTLETSTVIKDPFALLLN